jgi:hypothetical protein
MCSALAHVSFGPKADISRLFDHRVGPGEQRRWQLLTLQFSIVDENETNGFVLAVVSSLSAGGDHGKRRANFYRHE